jgi:acetyl esterase/lipase
MRIPKMLVSIAVLGLVTPVAVTAQAQVEEDVVIGMVSGLALVMDVHTPQRSNGFGIVAIPGSGWQRPMAYDAAPLSKSPRTVGLLAGPLVEAGYTVFLLNHRASPRFQFPAPLEDVQRAVRFIRYHAGDYGIDPTRIGAWGSSSGGHLAQMLGLKDGAGDAEDLDPVNQASAKVQTVVTWYAPTELASISTPTGIRATTQLIGRAPLGAPTSIESRMYREASPVTFVSRDDPPTLLVHGDADAVVPYDQSELMRDALTGSGVATRLIRVPGGGHGAEIESGANPPDYVGATIEWFRQYLVR